MFTIFNKTLMVGILLSVFTSAYGVSYSGKTQWAEVYDLSSYVSASVAKILVKEGQKITKDQLLLKLDDTNLRLDFEIAKAQVARLSPNKEMAELDFNRALELYDRELISDVALKTAEFKFTEVNAEFDAAKAVQHKAAFLLEGASINSPIDGRILSINTTIGFFANIEKVVSLLTLVNDKTMHAVGYLKVSQWNAKLINKKATIIINKTKYNGVVESLSLTPITNAKGLSVYSITVSFKPKNLIPAGMPVTINIK